MNHPIRFGSDPSKGFGLSLAFGQEGKRHQECIACRLTPANERLLWKRSGGKQFPTPDAGEMGAVKVKEIPHDPSSHKNGSEQSFVGRGNRVFSMCFSMCSLLHYASLFCDIHVSPAALVAFPSSWHAVFTVLPC